MFDKIMVNIDEDFKMCDKFKLLQSIIFFAEEVLSIHKHKYRNAIYHIEDYEDDTARGKFFAFDEDLHMLINYPKIIKYGTNFESINSDLFFVILHETGHAIQLLERMRRGSILEKLMIK